MLSTNQGRLWIVGGLLLSLVLFAGGYFLAVAPQRERAADAIEQRESVESQNAKLRTKIATLKKQFADLPARQAELSKIQTALPKKEGMANLVRDLERMATENGVFVQNITPGTANPIPIQSPGAEPSGAAAAPTPAPTAGGAAGAPAAGDILAEIPVSMTVLGTFHKTEGYLRSLQNDIPRAMMIDGLNVSTVSEDVEAAPGIPAQKRGDVVTTITARVFVFKSANDAGPAVGSKDGKPAPTPNPTATK